MKSQFSLSWKSSKQRRKQRKFRHNAPLYVKHKFLSSNLSRELRKKYKKRNFPLRKDDMVKVMTGQFKGKTGKVIKILTQETKIHIENIQLTKRNNTKSYIPIHSSNVQILELNLSDKERLKALKR